MITMPNKRYSIFDGKLFITFQFNHDTFNMIIANGNKAIVTYYIEEADNIKNIYGKINNINISEEALTITVGETPITFDSIIAINIVEMVQESGSGDISQPQPGEKFITSLKELALPDMQNIYTALNAEDAFIEIGNTLKLLKNNSGIGIIDDIDELSRDSTFSAAEIIYRMNARIGQLVGASPAFLDTLAELSSAINNNPNFGVELLNAISNKVDKISGKGLSSNDYISGDKTKVNKLIISGDGNLYLGDDGLYHSHNGAVINDLSLDSTSTTLSAYMIISQIGSEMAKIVGTTPDLLNTLDELANAINDNPNFATDILNLIGNKVDKISGKGLSTNDYNTIDKNKVDKIITNGAGTMYFGNDGLYHSVETGAVINDLSTNSTSVTWSVSKIMSQITEELNKLIDSSPDLLNTLNELSAAINDNPNFGAEIINLMAGKVDKVEGMGLSTNDYTADEKSKLALIKIIGAGSLFLADDGTYKAIPEGGVAIDDNNTTSTSTTLSSSKIMAQIGSELAKIIGTTPDLLNTLDELAAAINDNPNFATDIISSIGNKVDKVAGKGLSTNDYVAGDKTKVDKIITNGDGASYFGNDGLYHAAGTGSEIDDTNTASTSTTLSAAKIMAQITAEMATLVGSSPDLLNTLDELSAAINDNPNFATEIMNLISNKVDKVAGKGLSTNDYNATDKAKVDKIIDNGAGDKFLSNDGTYKAAGSGGTGAGIDDVTPSTSTTYSSSKIEEELAALTGPIYVDPMDVKDSYITEYLNMTCNSATINIVANMYYPLNAVMSGRNIDYNTSAYYFILKANKTYNIASSLIPNGSGRFLYQLKDVDMGTGIGAGVWTSSVDYAVSMGAGVLNYTFTPTKDTKVGLWISTVIGTFKTLDYNAALTVTEIAQPVVVEYNNLNTKYVDPMDVKDQYIAEYADLYMSATQTLASGSTRQKIAFNAAATTNIPVNLINNSIHLTKGKTYRIYANLALNTSARLTYNIADASNLVPFGADAMAISVNYNELYTNSPLNIIYTATADIDICVVVVSAVVSANLLHSFCRFNVQEIMQPVVVEYNNNDVKFIDPMDVKDSHEVGVGYYYAAAATVSTDSLIYFGENKMSKGGLSLNGDGTVRLKAGKTYRIMHDYRVTTVSGSIGLSLFNVTDNIGLGGYGVTQPSANYASSYSGYGYNGTIIETTKDIDICLKCTYASVANMALSVITMIVTEIVQPVVVEYNNYNEVANPLTTSPLEYAEFGINADISNYLANTPIVFDKVITGNMVLNNGGFLLKAGKTYEIGVLYYLVTPSPAAHAVYLYSKLISNKLMMISNAVDATLAANRATNGLSRLYTPSVDTYCTISIETDVTTIGAANLVAMVKEYRNNPVNQYGGFEKKVLFDGKFIIPNGSVKTSMTVPNKKYYDFLIFYMGIDTGTTFPIVDVVMIEGNENFYYQKESGDDFYAYTFQIETFIDNDVVDFYSFKTSNVVHVKKIIGIKGQLPTLLTGGEF